MSENTQSVYPGLKYRDVRGAISWLGKAFAAEARTLVPGEGDRVEHAEVRIGDGIVMLGSAGDPGGSGVDWPAGAGCVYLVTSPERVDAEFARAAAAPGAEVVRAVADTDYGSRDYIVRDPLGNLWGGGTYRRGSPAAASYAFFCAAVNTAARWAPCTTHRRSMM